MFLARIEKWTWSVEGRLTLLFTAGTMALLIGISVTLYGAVRHYLDQRTAALLADRIADARGDMEGPGGVQALIKELAEPETGPPDYWLRVVNDTGETLAESPGMAERAPVALFPAAHGDGMARRDLRGKRSPWLSLAAQAVNVGGIEYRLQVAEDRHEDLEFLDELRWMLRGLGGAAVLFSGSIAIWVTRWGLRPLREMEQAVAHVRASRLHERLGMRPWPRELEPLAAGFDGMMDRLEESFTRLSQFSADLAHELRTPIANLRGEAEVTLTKDRTAEEYRQVLESSVEEYARLAALTEKLLFLARADAEEAELKPEELDGRAAIDALWEFYEPYAEERGVIFKCAGTGPLRADAVLLRRAVANLIENALRFTPRGKAVTVEVAEGGVVKVVDTGVGIAPEHLPRLFDRFYQVDTARREYGTGLGLALVKSIMELHGGSVAITSEPGRGTEAVLRFPPEWNG